MRMACVIGRGRGSSRILNRAHTIENLIRKMKVVVEGCCHGELDKIYHVIGQLQEREGLAVDLLICCGDFQAVRDKTDLQCMAVPPKYREMGSFYKYYSGEKTAPVLTIFIGGNHEASNHLWELSYGGWVAPNIFYLGTAGVVQYGGLRIAGLSGIYKEGDYRKGHFECAPFSEGTKRSIYHVRSCDIFRLKQGIYHHGNKAQLLRKKTYFADEISQNTLGSPAAMEMLQHLQPAFWFSAHLHVKFAAVYRHQTSGATTKFLALDKCLPGRRFLQVLDIPSPSPPPYHLNYDAEWLAILRSTEPLMNYSQSLWLPPHPSTDLRVVFTPMETELKDVEQLFKGNLIIPNNFTATVTPHTSTPSHHHSAQPVENGQTALFCQTLGIANPFTPNFRSHNASLHSTSCSTADYSNPDEIELNDEENDTFNVSGLELTNQEPAQAPTATSTPHKPRYPWLDNSSGDELDPESDSQSGLCGGRILRTTFDSSDDDRSLGAVQRSLRSEIGPSEEISSEMRPSVESCDRGGDVSCAAENDPVGRRDIQCSGSEAVPGVRANPDEISVDSEDGICLDDEDVEEGTGGEGGRKGESEPETSAEDGGRDAKRRVLSLPQPRSLSPCATVMCEQLEKPDKSQVGGECRQLGSKVTQGVRKPSVIKRRNLAMYQSHDDEVIN